MNQQELFDLVQPLVQKNSLELPRTAEQLVEVIGLHATIKLVHAEGGNILNIPNTVQGQSKIWVRLFHIVGAEAAATLVAFFGNTRIYVPMCRETLRKIRNLDIIRRYDAGEAFDDIRKRYQLSRGHLFRILKKPEG